MKATELMLGDWVIMNNSPHQLDAGDLKNIFANLENDGKDDARYLSPITLTPEILKKNGFDRYGEIYIYEKKGLKIQISLGVYVRIFCAMDMTVNFNRDFYVHSLQHAIRICGIKKEIEL